MEAQKTFSIKKSLQQAWGIFKKDFGFLVLLTILTGVGYFVLGLIEQSTTGTVGLFVGLITYAARVFLSMIALTAIYKAAKGQPLTTKSITSHSKDIFVTYLVASLLFGIGAAVGMALLVIPGIIFMMIFQFYAFEIIEEKDVSIIQSLKNSAAITKGVRWKLLGFWATALALIILGVAVFIIGALVASIVASIAMALIYSQLKKQTKFA